ncbi:MAG: EamA family transporter RarD, partial [Candidatus Cloacimonadota bacterium]
TLQFLIGLIVFKEAFSNNQLIGFSFVWLALIIYTANNIMNKRKRIETTNFTN